MGGSGGGICGGCGVVGGVDGGGAGSGGSGLGGGGGDGSGAIGGGGDGGGGEGADTITSPLLTGDSSMPPELVPETTSFTVGGGASTVMEGYVTILMPSALEASPGVPRLEESISCTAVAVVEASTAMLAVMITLPAATATVTSDLSTPAALAKFCFKSSWTLSG